MKSAELIYYLVANINRSWNRTKLYRFEFCLFVNITHNNFRLDDRIPSAVCQMSIKEMEGKPIENWLSGKYYAVFCYLSSTIDSHFACNNDKPLK